VSIIVYCLLRNKRVHFYTIFCGIDALTFSKDTYMRNVLFCSNWMCGHTAGVRCDDNTQRKPRYGEVQPVARRVPSEVFQHEVDR